MVSTCSGRLHLKSQGPRIEQACCGMVSIAEVVVTGESSMSFHFWFCKYDGYFGPPRVLVRGYARLSPPLHMGYARVDNILMIRVQILGHRILFSSSQAIVPKMMWLLGYALWKLTSPSFRRPVT